jgi:hypothetical protein
MQVILDNSLQIVELFLEVFCHKPEFELDLSKYVSNCIL